MNLDLLLQPLQWRWKDAGFLGKEYELVAGDDAIALLKFESLFSRNAKLSFQDQSWLLQQDGVFATRTIIQQTGSATEEAIFSSRHSLMSLSKVGELVLNTGLSLSVRRSGLIHDVWHIDSSNEELLFLKLTGVVRHGAEVHAAAALHNVRTPLLIITFAFYIALVHLMDDW